MNVAHAPPDARMRGRIYLVEQLYANVDVPAEIEQALPGNVKALSAPLAAATRQLALNVAERALDSPRVQALVSDAVRRAHEQFVSLIRDKGDYVSTTGGDVTLDYGSVVADLAVRLGVDPATISEIRRVVRDLSTDLRETLTTAQARIRSARAELAQVQGGSLSSQTQQRLGALQQTLAELETKIASLEQAIQTAEAKAPSQLQGRLRSLDARLSNLDGRVTSLEREVSAVLEDPSEANVERLDPSLAAVQERINTVLGRQVVQNPGQLVVIGSDQLDGVQTAVRALRNLGVVLPLLAFLLYVGAIYLARGWRRQALIAAGGGILVSTLLVLLVRRLAGNAVVDSVAGSETVKPAVQSVWGIVTEGLRARSLAIFAIGLAFVLGGLLAGPGRHAVALRRWLAPYLRDQPVVVYSVVAILFLLWLAFITGINNLGQVLVIVALLALAVVGSKRCGGKRPRSSRPAPTVPDRRPASGGEPLSQAPGPGGRGSSGRSDSGAPGGQRSGCPRPGSRRAADIVLSARLSGTVAVIRWHGRPSDQTVRLGCGRHSPHAGVCVMELATMLAQEPFSDRADFNLATVGAFLRTYKDGLEDVRRETLSGRSGGRRHGGQPRGGA